MARSNRTPTRRRTPDLMRKGGPQRDRTKHHRPSDREALAEAIARNRAAVLAHLLRDED